MVKERNATVRQDMIRLLREGPRTIRDLSQELGVMEKDLPMHLASVEKTLKNSGDRLISEACRCMACGFEFKDRKKFSKPGKCPKCRHSHIERAVFHIE
jgi:transcriptional regulator